jgi:Putative esterase
VLFSFSRQEGLLMEQIEYRADPSKQSKNLVILMPGAGDTHEMFAQNGFIDAARKSPLNADILTVNAHYGYFTDMTVRERIHTDVVLPAQSRGYEGLWMGGISLGGFGALIYAQRYAEKLKGLFLIAPYIGNRGTFAEIKKADGLDHWHPENLTEFDERNIWMMIKNYRADLTPTLPIHLLYGKQDRFAAFHQLLAERLADDKVIAVEGGHDWPTWQESWRQLMTKNSGNALCI